MAPPTSEGETPEATQIKLERMQDPADPAEGESQGGMRNNKQEINANAVRAANMGSM